MKYPCGGAKWTLDLHDSMKICEKPENVLLGLWIHLHPSTMCSYFSHSQTFRHLMNIKICAWRWSWEKIFDFKFHGEFAPQLYFRPNVTRNLYPKNWHYCSISNYSSGCYSKVRACSQIATILGKKKKHFSKVFSGRH